ncbi:UNVERIFIED_CONTAM: hypothetical protein FKN15_040496 [Acipenser sinensis]
MGTFGEEPRVVHGGIKYMKVLKSTQSGFEGFVKDRFTTLPEVRDRCFCTMVYTKWRYNKLSNVTFDAVCKTVKDSILEKFACLYNRGEYSPSVQKTLYNTQVLVLNRVLEVLLPLDNPSGNIAGIVRTKSLSRL